MWVIRVFSGDRRNPIVDKTPAACVSQRLGVGPGTRDQRAPVVGVPDQPVVRQTRRAGVCARCVGGVPGPPGALAMCSSRTDKATLLSSGDRIAPCGVPVSVSFSSRVLGEDARLQKRLHQGQDTLVPDPSPHPVHQGRMRDFVEARLDVALDDPLVGAGRSGSAPRPPRHGPGASGGTRTNTAGSPPRRSAPTPASGTPGPPGRSRSAIPSRRILPPGLGIIRSRTGNGRKLRSFNAARSSVEEHLDPGVRPRSSRRWLRPLRPCAPPCCPAPDPTPPTGTPGSADEVEQIIEPAMRIIIGPSVQLGLDLQYPTLRPIQGGRPVRRYSPATSWHSHTSAPAGPLRPAPAFPDSCAGSPRLATTTRPPPRP